MAVLHVSVTQEDIDNSNGLYGDTCMCHHAIRRLIPEGRLFIVGLYNVAFKNYKDAYKEFHPNFTLIPLPADVERRVTEHYKGWYEDGPFEFDLKVPDEVLEESCQK